MCVGVLRCGNETGAAPGRGSSGEWMLQGGERDRHRFKSRLRRRRAARCAATAKDLEDDHGCAAARTWRAMIGRGVRIGCIPCRRRGGLWDRGGDQLPGACDVGFAAGTCEQPIMADAVKSLGQDVKQKAPDELVSSEGHRAIPLLPVTAVILVAKSDTPLVESDEGAV